MSRKRVPLADRVTKAAEAALAARHFVSAIDMLVGIGWLDPGALASVLGHADRVRPFSDYCIGLLSAEGRKSVEPLAAVTAPERTAAQHQSLLHFVAQAPWSDQAMLRRVREAVLPSITRDEPIQAWIIDDTGFPKACPRA